MSSRTSNKYRRLIKEANENGIFFREDGDDKFTARIAPDRHIYIDKGKNFITENLNEIYHIADYGNMEYHSRENTKKLALIPAH